MNMRKHPLYKTLDNMKSRCYNLNHPNYIDYGGRGITICDRWKERGGFSNFLEDMGERPEGYSLERIDNELGYFPENCKWADKTQQANNNRKVKHAKGFYKRGNHYIARINIAGKVLYLGYYDTKEEAHNKYVEVRDKKLKEIL